jgi:hypothetical protein
MPLFRSAVISLVVLHLSLQFTEVQAESNARAAAAVPSLSVSPIAPKELVPLSELPENTSLTPDPVDPEQPKYVVEMFPLCSF